GTGQRPGRGPGRSAPRPGARDLGRGAAPRRARSPGKTGHVSCRSGASVPAREHGTEAGYLARPRCQAGRSPAAVGRTGPVVAPRASAEMIEKVFWGEALAFLKPGRRGIFRIPFLYDGAGGSSPPREGRATPRFAIPA